MTSECLTMVRFVQLRRPIAELLAHDNTTAGVVAAADAFRDELLSLSSNHVDSRYRARLVPQSELWQAGVELGFQVRGETPPPNVSSDEGEYFGGKWGVFIRAPDTWFELLDKYGDRFIRMGQLAEVRFGVKSGKDEFFYPRDISQECLEEISSPKEFKQEYGTSRKSVESGKVLMVSCGKGGALIKPLESKFLEPEVHSLMEVDGFTVNPEDCSRLIFLCDQKKDELSGTHALGYVKWGEKQKYHTGATCAARVTDDRTWYDLTGHRRGQLFWPKAQQYKHAIPVNDHNLQCNCNLYDVHIPSKTNIQVTAGILNSSITVLSKYQYGRPVGVEGNLKTEVVDVNMMLVPNPTAGSAEVRKRIAKAFRTLKKRDAHQFLSERRMREMAYRDKGKIEELETLSDEAELDMPDRMELDDAVLELLGIRSKKRRIEIREEIYAYLRRYFEFVRRKEEQAIVNKKASKRKAVAKPANIAEQVLEEIAEKHGHLLHRYDPDFLNKSLPFDTYELPAEGEPAAESDMFTPHAVKFTKGKKKTVAHIPTTVPGQDVLIVALAKSSVRGLVRVPPRAG